MKVLAVLGCLATAGLAVANCLGPPGPTLTCHRGLDGAFQQWMIETTNGDWYPNAEGSSVKSLALLAPYYGSYTNQLRDYK